MTGTLAQIWRHPVKAHGRERIAAARLEPGRALPWDRAFAVAHERSAFQPEAPDWVRCGNFTRAASLPLLQAISCETEEETGRLTFTHPDRPPLTIDPETEGAAFIDWVMPLSLGGPAKPARLVKAGAQPLTDADFPSISLINLASHKAVEAQLGHEISPMRWRGNLLVDGLEPWVEMSWIGQTLQLGDVVFEVAEPITRCRSLEANPETGRRDADPLRALQTGFGHTDCGVLLTVKTGGEIREGMTLAPS